MEEVLKDPALQSLEEAFADWIRQVLLPARAPGIEVPRLRTIKEVKTMLAERVKQWPKQWLKEGREQGLKQGLKKGLKQGRQEGIEEGRQQERRETRQSLLETALRLLEWRFGPLDPETRQLLEERSNEELIRLTGELPTAASLHDLGLG